MSPETQHAYEIGILVLLTTIVIALVMFVFLSYFMQKYRSERNLAYNILLREFPNKSELAREIANEFFEEKPKTDEAFRRYVKYVEEQIQLALDEK